MDSFHFKDLPGDGRGEAELAPIEDGMLQVVEGPEVMLWPFPGDQAGGGDSGTTPAGQQDLTIVGIAGGAGTDDDAFAF